MTNALASISLGQAPGTDYTKTGASNADIRRLIPKKVKQGTAQTKKVAVNFKGKNNKETAQNIWKFLKHNINYKADGFDEQIVKAPSALLREKQGDCKSYAVFTSSILNNLNIPHSLTYASYSADPTPEHVYVTTSEGYIIDPVYLEFNKEKKPKHKYQVPMNLKGITGTNNFTTTISGGPRGRGPLLGISGIEMKPGAHAVAKVALAPARLALNGLLRINALGLSSVIEMIIYRAWTKRDGKDYNPVLEEKIKPLAYNLGYGDKSNAQWQFTKQTKDAARKKAIGINLLFKLPADVRGRYYSALKDAVAFYKKGGYDITTRGTNGIGEAVSATAAVIGEIALAAPVLIPILKEIIGSFRQASDSELAGGDSNLGIPKSDPKPPGGTLNDTPGGSGSAGGILDQITSAKIAGVPVWMLAVGAGAALYFLNKKK